MKTITTLLTVAALAFSAIAEESAPSLFGPNELTIDLSATYTAAEPRGIEKVFDTDARGGDFGVSLGLTKYFTEHFGVGGDVGIVNAGHIDSVDYFDVFFVARLPFQRFAPYALAGVGRDLHAGRYAALVGGGIEYRFTERVGTFVESRFVFSEVKRGDSLVSRLGVRFAF